jgi:hypothetical protein
MNRVAVAIFHGIGCRGRKFADGMIDRLSRCLREKAGTENASRFVLKAIEWGHVVQPRQTQLCDHLKMDCGSWLSMRRRIVDWMGDAIAYEPTFGDCSVRRAVRASVTAQLRELAHETGNAAPLCVIAHSFGSIVAANYLRDVQQSGMPHISRTSSPGGDGDLGILSGECPMAVGRSLTMLVTLGSPLALWTLRRCHPEPALRIPTYDPACSHPPSLGIWLNIIGRSDVLAYPISGLGIACEETLIDLPIKLGGILTGWSPLSHFHYWRDTVVNDIIATALLRVAHKVN